MKKIVKKLASGGIGRRVGLKIQRPKGHVGSSPSLPTKSKTWEQLQKEHPHVCEPKTVMLFTVETYQCGCGKYFTREHFEDSRKGH